MIILLLVATIIVSVACLRNRELFMRLALSPYQVVHHRQYYRLLSHMFVHGGSMHLVVNLIVLFSFGTDVIDSFEYLAEGEMMSIPTLHMLVLYFGGGVTAAVLGLRRHKDDPSALSVGASGGVASVVFTSIFFDPWGLLYVFGLVPIPGILFGVAYILYSWRMADRANDNIDHRAHLYGALFGLIYPLLINHKFFTFFLQGLQDFPWL